MDTPEQMTALRVAGLLRTPSAATDRQSVVQHTPLDRSVRSNLVHSIRRDQSGQSSQSGGAGSVAVARPPLTPHARAALRGRAQRRAIALTPGCRRNSIVRERRDSPFGVLKSLGRLLAPTSQPIDPSPPSSSSSASTVVLGIGVHGSRRKSRGRRASSLGASERFHSDLAYDEDDDNDEDDDDLLLSRRPRLSLPIDAYGGDDYDDDDSSDLRPHRSGLGLGLDDDNYTAHSIELPRRALFGNQNRESLGGGRLSELYIPNQSLVGGEAAQSAHDDDGGDLAGADAASTHRLDNLASRRETLEVARESDFGLHVPLDLLENVDRSFSLGLRRKYTHRSVISESAASFVTDDAQGKDGRQTRRSVSSDSDASFAMEDALAQANDGMDGGDIYSSRISPELGSFAMNRSRPSPELGSRMYDDDDRHGGHGNGALADQSLPLDHDDEQMDYFDDDQDDDDGQGTDVSHVGAGNQHNSTRLSFRGGDPASMPRSRHSSQAIARSAAKHGTRSTVRMSRLGLDYPVLPAAFIKKTARACMRAHGAANSRLSADTVAALTDASDWFLEQVGADLAAYSAHAKRKTIDESDVLLLMKRQSILGSRDTIFSLSQRHLPRELLSQIRMPPKTLTTTSKRRRLAVGHVAGETTL